MGEAATEYTFTCPTCEESLVVNDSMKAALVERGCVLCSGDVTEGDFSEDSTVSSE